MDLTDAEIEAWFARIKEPAQSIVRRIAERVMGAEPRIDAYLKYGTLQLGYKGDLANFVQVGKVPVTLMFNRGARIAGPFPDLEGDGPSARFMRFADLAVVDERAEELGAIAAAWCHFADGLAPTATAASR